MKKPNLFIIGAMKSGTTSLHYYLSKHPEIFMSDPKEPGYFREDSPSIEHTNWYYSLFQNASRHKYIGEGSTDYTKLPQYNGVAQRIRADCGDVKIIYIMRNPYQRTISHYWHTVRPQKTDGQTKNLYNAVKSFEGYLSFSDYNRQIQPYIDCFKEENIHYILFEELISEPKKVLLSVFDFLDVSNEFQWDVASKRLNSKPKKIKKVSGSGLLHRLSYSKSWSVVSKLIPKFIKNILKRSVITEVDQNKESNNAKLILEENIGFYQKIKLEAEEKLSKDLTSTWKF